MNILKKVLGYEDIANIKVRQCFKKSEPNKEKVKHKEDYYKKTGKFDGDIVISSKNKLVDGYINYLIAKKYNIQYVKVKRLKK